MAKLTLYHATQSRSAIVRWLLEELGEPYELQVVALFKGAQRQADYLKINPMGKVPALMHGDALVTEVGAICTYLADEFPDAKLNVPVGDPQRGPYLRWLFYTAGCIEPAISDRLTPRKEPPHRGMLGYGDFDRVMGVTTKALETGPYLLGDHFTAADILMGSTLRWGMMIKMLPELPEFVSYLERLMQRPALQRTLAFDQELLAAEGK